MITREQALTFLNENVENKNIIKHMIACEKMMEALAEYFGEDKQVWGLAGLLHDGDYRPEVPVEKQGMQITKMLQEKSFDVPEETAHAMAAHNWHNNGIQPESKMDWSLFCGDSLTGLIVASALVLPSKKLSDVTTETVLNRFKEKSFAKGTRREDILLCEEKLGLSLNEFVKITLEAMQKNASELGL